MNKQEIQEAKAMLARLKHEKWAREFNRMVALAIAEDKMQKCFAKNVRRLDEAFPQPTAFKPSTAGWFFE